MATIPPLNLAANPDVQITLREATVSDCLDFSGVTPDHEEEVATLFLDRIQTTAVGSSRDWTAEDRRLVLFWYWLHTADDPTIPITYDCQYCGKSHNWNCSGAALAAGYRPLQGEGFRTGKFKADPITVRSLTGFDMESLEARRLLWLEAVEQHGEGSGEAQRQAKELDLARLVCCVNFTEPDAPKQDYAVRAEKIKAMSYRDFVSFAEYVVTLLEDLAHGLPAVFADGKIYLLTPEHECPNTPGRMTRIRVPFRLDDFLPGL